MCQMARGNGHIRIIFEWKREREGGMRERDAIGSCPFKRERPGVFPQTLRERDLGESQTKS